MLVDLSGRLGAAQHAVGVDVAFLSVPQFAIGSREEPSVTPCWYQRTGHATQPRCSADASRGPDA